MSGEGIEVRGPDVPGAEQVATDEALQFVAMLVRRFGPARDRLLSRRRETQERLRAGALPDFLPETAAVRRRLDGGPGPADLRIAGWRSPGRWNAR